MEKLVLPPGCARLFRFDSLLSAGASAHVYLAKQVALGRDVAVKVLDPQHLGDAEQVERFKQEARLTAALSHPNIVVAIDHGVEPEGAWIAYEYLPGRSLETRMALGRMGIDASVEMARDVLAALQEAHAVGVYHRDVKPANVIEAEDGRWKLADFGIARFTGESSVKTETGVIVGTPHYLAPERIRGEPATAGSDVYAVGVMLYRALTGELPFRARQMAAILDWQLHGVRPWVAEALPEAGRKLAGVVAKAMMVEPGERFASASQMRAALDAAVAPKAPSLSRTLVARRPAPPYAMLSAVTAALVAAAVLVHRGETPAPVPEASASAAPVRALDVDGLMEKFAGRREPFWKRNDARESMKRYLEMGGFPATVNTGVKLGVPGGGGLMERFEAKDIAAMIAADRADTAAMDQVLAPVDERLAAGDADLATALAAIQGGRELLVAVQVSAYLSNVLEASKVQDGDQELMAIQRRAEKLPLPPRALAAFARGLAGLERAAELMASGAGGPATARLGPALRDLEKLHEYRVHYVKLTPEHEARAQRLESRAERTLAKVAAGGPGAALARAARAAALLGRYGRFSRDGRLAVPEEISALESLLATYPEAAGGLRVLIDDLKVKK